MNINRQKLVEELNTTTEYGFYGEFMDGSEVGYTLRELMQIIKSQPPADQWIPCSERLPEEGANYEATVIGRNNKRYTTILYYSEEFKEWECECNVIAWRERLEPYKGAE